MQEVLRALPFLHHVPERLFEAVIEAGTLQREFAAPLLRRPLICHDQGIFGATRLSGC